MGCLSGKIDEMEKIVFHDTCKNAVSLAGNIKYFDFVFSELELCFWVRTDLVPCTTTGTRGTTQRVV